MSNPISIAAFAASDYANIGFGCYFVCFLISWFLGAQAYRRLSPTEAVTLRNASFKAGILMRIGVFVGVALIFALSFLRLPHAGLAAGMLFWLLMAYIAVIQAWNTRRLRVGHQP